MIVKPRERSDRAPSSGRSERSERDRTTIRGSGATVRHHRQERAKRCAISEVRERSDRSRANEVSVGMHTTSGRGSGATVRHHRQGASGASVIEPHIYGMSEIYAFSNERA